MTLDPAVLADPGFGAHFTDHMVLVDFSEQNGWHDRRVLERCGEHGQGCHA